MNEVETLIVGAGQAGLALSWQLTQRKRPHVILERARTAETWRQKWDSFRLLTPNAWVQLPGFPLEDQDPGGFITRDEIVRHLEAYATSFGAPIKHGVEVLAVVPTPAGFRVDTSAGVFHARNVVVATGGFPVPNTPACAANLPADIHQVHSRDYKNPQELPPGGVLVVGSAQSGFQIAEETRAAGRDVVLSIGSCGWAPRAYRGRDTHSWLEAIGLMDHTEAVLRSPSARFECTTNIISRSSSLTSYRALQTLGVEFVGRVLDISGHRVEMGGDVEATLAKADGICMGIKKMIDGFIQKTGAEAPPAEESGFGPAAANDGPTSIDLAARGIRTVLWATGFRYDFAWIQAPIFDANGYPEHTRGVTAQPGLVFIGLPWLSKRKSSLLLGTEEDSAYLAEQLAQRSDLHEHEHENNEPKHLRDVKGDGELLG